MSEKKKQFINTPFKLWDFKQATTFADNDVYRVMDLPLLDTTGKLRFTVSTTVLHPKQSTRGHMHDHWEVYSFMSGNGVFTISIGNKIENVIVEAGKWAFVEGQMYHKVTNFDESVDLTFFTFSPERVGRPPFVTQ